MKKRYSFLKETLKGTKEQIVWILIVTILNSKLNVYVPMFIQYALDGVVLGNEMVIPVWIRRLFVENNPILKLLILGSVLVGINSVMFVFQYARGKMSTKFNLKVNRNVKTMILSHVAKLEYQEFSQISHSDVIQRVNGDATLYAEFFNSQMNLFLDTIFIVVFAIVQIFALNWICGWFVLVLCVVIVGLSVWFYKASKPLVEDTVEANRQVIEKTREAVVCSKMQKAFNRKTKEIRDFCKLNEDYRKKEIKLGIYRQIYVIGTHSIRNFKEPVILLLGGVFVVQGKISLATVSILLSLATKISDYIYETVDKLKEMNEFLVSYQKLSHLMQVKEEDNQKEYRELTGNISLKNVTIKAGQVNVIENIHLEIKRGEKIAIIGDNGVGKTVLAKTLLGFYEYDGTILIGDTNVKDVHPQSVRDYIGIVLQDTYLFHDTILHNVIVTNPEILECEAEECLKVADMYRDVQRMENKMDTMLENGGDNVSGGQKQRLAIARNMTANNQFMILDDSFSKLDTRTKQTILQNMMMLHKGVMIISHDRSVVETCDRVLFIYDKKVLVNTHSYFMENHPVYRQMFEVKQNCILEEEE